MKNISIQINHSGPGSHQYGAATLVTSLVLLVAMTVITIFAARSAVMEQKIFANEFRSKQAFEAAEAGLEHGIAYLLATGGADKDDNNVIDTITNNPVALSNGADYLITLTDNSGGDFNNITVESRGRSDDDSATATVRQVVALVPALPNVPGNPIISKGSVVLNGSATVTNPEGNATIWSGSNSLTFGGSGNGKTYIPDPSNPSNLIQSSSSAGPGPDVILGDTNLSSKTDAEFFQAFMGVDKTTFMNGSTVRQVAAANVSNAYNAGTPGLDLARREIIWVNGNTNMSSNTTVGCTQSVTGAGVCPSASTKPVITVIDGDFSANGTVKFYGLVYITGDFVGSGNLEVTGAVIMEGGVTGTGSLDVNYSSSVLQKARLTTGAPATLAGSWHDF